MAIVCLGALVGPLDTTVNTAFPVITAAFALAPHEIQWVVIAFVLAQSAVTLVFGRLGDLFGHRPVFGAGLAACVVAHLAVAWAPDFGTMVAMRAFQGLAVGVVVACSVALATQLFAPEDKAAVVAIYVMATSLAMGLGPWIGGLLLEAFGWPGVFWFRAPLALAVLLLLPRVHPAAVPAPRGRDGQAPQGASFDWAGAAGLVGSLSVLVLAIAETARPEGSAVRALLGFALGAALTVAFVRHASRTEHPVIRIEPFADRRFTAVQAASVAIAFACFANLLLLPYVLMRDPRMSLVGAGLMLSLYPGGAVVGASLAGRFARRMPPQAMMIAGLALSSLGLLATAAAMAGGATFALAPGMLLAGMGTGFYQVGYLDATTSMLPAHERGVAGSLVSVTRLLGVVLGASGISWINARLGNEAATFAVLGLLLVAASIPFAVVMRARTP